MLSLLACRYISKLSVDVILLKFTCLLQDLEITINVLKFELLQKLRYTLVV